MPGATSASVRLDWLRLVFPEHKRAYIVRWCREWWGREERMEHGRYGFRQGCRFATGAEVWWDRKPQLAADGTQRKQEGFIDLSGAVLGEWDGDQQMQALRELWDLGCTRATHIDVAIDYKGMGLTWLIDAMLAAWEAGQVCRTSVCTGRQATERAFCGQRIKLSDGITFGRRGSCGSGRQVQVYDKGLERKITRTPGGWVRMETRLYGACAATALGLLVGADEWERSGECKAMLVEGDGVPLVKGWRAQAVGIVLGSIDFRERPTGKSRSLKRRVRLAWWARMVEGEAAVTITPGPRHASTWETFKRWHNRCYKPTLLRLAAASGESVVEVLRVLNDRLPVDLSRASPVVEEFVRTVLPMKRTG